MPLDRRDFLSLAAAGAALAATSRLAHADAVAPIAKPIPASGELLPAVGVGTARRYQSASGETELRPLREALRTFIGAGGKVIDTAPSYGSAESLVGRLIADLKARDSVFLATKVGAEGRQQGRSQIEQSFRNLRTDRIDLIAVHNLRDVDTQLATLRELKEAGRIRYLGATTSFPSQHEPMAELLRREKLDFVQVDYAPDNRAVEKNVLPAARDQGVAVMINLPFGRGRVFQTVQNQPLPPWAGELGIQTWAQFFLKYIISHEAVTCVIPGTATARYAADNAGAMQGPLPDAQQRKRMEAVIDAV